MARLEVLRKLVRRGRLARPWRITVHGWPWRIPAVSGDGAAFSRRRCNPSTLFGAGGRAAQLARDCRDVTVAVGVLNAALRCSSRAAKGMASSPLTAMCEGDSGRRQNLPRHAASVMSYGAARPAEAPF